jgi:deaminated glutathione amidase
MKVAIHQMCSGTDPLANVAHMERAIETASANGASMYFAPEMSVLIDRDRERSRPKIFSENKTPALAQLCSAAARCSVWLHIGSAAVRREADDSRLANRSFVIDDHGQIRARYDKMHLFDVALTGGEAWRESAVYDPGDGPVVVDTPLGLLGLAICYDLRFPDLFSALSRAGVDVIAIPSAFTVPTGKAHWHLLLRARAIETQAFVIAAAQSGLHRDGRSTYGHSLVVDPWGDVLLDMGNKEGIGYAEIDLVRLAEVRLQIPARQNRRDIISAVKRY